jgi:hypothetical protein
MLRPLRHRQTQGAATVAAELQLPRHFSTLPSEVKLAVRKERAESASPRLG